MPLDDYNDLFAAAGKKHNVDPELLRAMAGTESNGDPNAQGPWIPKLRTRAQGLMMFIPSTAQQWGVNPFDPPSAVDGAARLMSHLLDKHGGNVDAALQAYNGGVGPRYAADIVRRYRSAVDPQAVPASSVLPPVAAPPPITPTAAPTRNFTPPPGTPNYFTGENDFPPSASAQPMPANTTAADLERQILEGPATAAPAAAGRAAEIMAAILEGKPIPGEPVPGGAVSGAFRRYVADPLNAARDPSQAGPDAQPLFGVPALQSLAAGAGQGVRDTQTLVDRGDKYLADQFPLYAWLDRNVAGHEPGSTIAGREAATAAYQQQQGDSWLAPVGRFAANLAIAAPVSAPAAAARTAVAAIPAIGRYVAPAVEGAVAGGGFNALTSGAKTGEEYWNDVLSGTETGAVLGGALGAGRSYFTRSAHPADQAIADRLGVRLSTGQASGGTLKHVEDATTVFPGSGAAKFAGQQRQQIADVIAREAGMPTGMPITTTSIGAAENRIGRAIEDAASRISVPVTPQFAQRLQDISDAALQAGTGTQQAATVQNLGRQVLSLFQNNNGVMPGDQFQRFIARGGPLEVAINSSVPEVRRVGTALREALLDAAQSGGAGAREALQDLQQARYQWKVIATVKPAMTRTGPGSEEVNLPGLAQAIRGEFNMGQTGGAANMQDLARLISGPLRSLPSSGTAERNFWQRALMGEFGIGGSTGAGAYFLAGLPLAHSVATGLALPLAVGSTVGRGMRHGIPGGAEQLFNRLIPQAGATLNRPSDLLPESWTR